MAEGYFAVAFRSDFVRNGVDECRRLLMFQIKRIPFFEKDGELPSLRSQPKTVLTTEGVDVRLGFAGGDEVVVDPAMAGCFTAAHGTGHDATLISRHDGNLWLPSPLAKRDDLDMFLEEGDVFGECQFFF